MATHVPAGGSLGGVVRYTSELLRALGDRDDVVVSALTTNAAAETVGALIGDRASVHTVPTAPTPILALAERYAPVAALRRSADVVQGTKHLLPRRSTALRVLTVHDMLLLDRPEDFGAVKRAFLPAAYRGSIRDADLLICVSDATRQRMEVHVPGSSRRSAVVHLASSPTLRQAVPKPVASLAVTRYALVVGDSSPRKNLRTVVEAWPEVRRRVPDAVLAVAGPPSWGRSIFGAAFGAGVDNGSIVALGHVNDAELRWAYQHAVVVLCPSLAEGFGLPAVEALDLGTPVIISEDNALREVAGGGARAVLPPLDRERWADAVVEAMSDTEARQPMSKARTWAAVADDTVAAVRRSLQGR